MSDYEKLVNFLTDLQQLDKMQARYPADSECGKAVVVCLATFQKHGTLLDPFFGRRPAKPDKKGGAKS